MAVQQIVARLEPKEIARKLAGRRKSLGWTQRRLAHEMHLVETTVHTMESYKGIRHVRAIAAYADALGMDAYVVFVPRTRASIAPEVRTRAREAIPAPAPPLE